MLQGTIVNQIMANDMSVESFPARKVARQSLLASVFIIAISGAGVSRAEELDAAERKKAVQSLRDYQALFKDRTVELDVRVRSDFNPTESEGPVWYDYKILASDGWMFSEQDIGPALGIGGGRSDASFTLKSVFDSRTNHGLEVFVRDDGKVTQATRKCVPRGIIRLSSERLAQAAGWLHFWPFRRDHWVLEAAHVLESSPVLRRVRAADGRTQLVARVVLEDVVEYEMRYSDLPQVRMTAVRITLPQDETTGEVRYKLDPDGFHQPHAFREIRRSVRRETPPKIMLIEEAIVTRFSMRSLAEPLPMPVIEVPDDVQVRDDCPDDKREDQVPTPTPETR